MDNSSKSMNTIRNLLFVSLIALVLFSVFQNYSFSHTAQHKPPALLIACLACGFGGGSTNTSTMNITLTQASYVAPTPKVVFPDGQTPFGGRGFIGGGGGGSNSTNSTNSTAGCLSNNGPIVSVTGSSQNVFIQITNQSGVVVTGSSNNVTINMPGPTCSISIRVTGSKSTLNVYNGSASLVETGSSASITFHNTVLTSESVTGSSSNVQGGMIDGNALTITGSSNKVQTLDILQLNSLSMTGSSNNAVINSASTNTTSVTITGSSDVLHINNAIINLTITGSSNLIYVNNTTILHQRITGAKNKVIQS